MGRLHLGLSHRTFPGGLMPVRRTGVGCAGHGHVLVSRFHSPTIMAKQNVEKRALKVDNSPVFATIVERGDIANGSFASAAGRTDLPDGLVCEFAVQCRPKKYFASPFGGSSFIDSLSRPHRRGVSRSSRTLGAGCKGRGCAR